MEKNRALLIRSFDEPLLPEEEKQLKEALNQSEELRKEKNELEAVRTLMSDYSPSLGDGFSKTVLDRIEAMADDNNLYHLFTRFALGGVAAILVLLISVYFTDGNLSTDSLLGLSDLSADNILLALSSF